ncbi:MFS transporter [Rhodococcus sp. BP-252]|uniref:MFS transporter n=1 Tax=Rhodococcoides kyotonense TaxID=398843 RepID=A0A177Y8B5_9NOCA|nr:MULTISPECIES: MFS transporter [Rhodococcus]MBY6410219.1 MFS transporter [Rhodococcus sp. BP-320]MBY6415188.1 MFS transporter [Rhodococcus sp. BP-321]MBY6421511.1 MFS transporter [Rhodococcus sp. BP-324]MBY6425504.1 MFS transporter [Rhodococcus sp. BP-323]MBY6430084.1 MFS transporter [Rhodococcus sp. BP-322]
MSFTHAAHDEQHAPATGPVVAVLAFAGIVVALMQTLVIPLIPQLPSLLNAPASDTAWVVTATLLAGAVAVPTMGRLGDMFGKRRMLLVSLGLLIAGSVVGALSSSLVPLVAGRALQGLAAGVIPLGISVMRDVLPVHKLPGSIALMSASLGVGGALGLPAAALIAEYTNWHFLFWTAAGLGAVVTVLVVTVVPESAVRTGGRFDFGGAASLSIGLVTLLLGISKGATWGWSSGTTLACFVVAAAAFAVWAWWELRVAQPLVDLRVSVGKQVLFTNLASIVFGFAMFAMTLVLPQVLQMPKETGFGLGQSMLLSGLVMAPSGLVMMVVAPLSSKITTTMGPKVTLMVGAITVAIGYGGGVFLMGAVWQLVLVSLVIGAGTGLAYGAMPALIMGAVPASETAAANSFNTLMRSLGTSFASAVAGVILAQMTMSMGSVSLPSQDGFKVVMGVAAGAAVVALVIAAFLPRFVPARPDADASRSVAVSDDDESVSAR